jgi:hypothetical protein
LYGLCFENLEISRFQSIESNASHHLPPLIRLQVWSGSLLQKVQNIRASNLSSCQNTPLNNKNQDKKAEKRPQLRKSGYAAERKSIDVAQIKSIRSAGASWRAIARKLGVSVGSAFAAAKDVCSRTATEDKMRG